MSSVAVLGGGISGLSAAYYLAKWASPATRITLIEGSSRLGGWIQSKHVGPLSTSTAQEDKILFEAGPRSLRPVGVSGAVALELIKDLDLTHQLLSVPKSDPSAQNRYIYYNDSINALPSSLRGVLFRRPPVLKSVIGAALREPFIPAHRDQEDESLYSIVSRRFNQHIALNLVGAVVHGIYAGDVKALSAQSTLRMLYDNERTHGSIVKGLIKGGVKNERFRERGIAVRARKSDPEWFAKMESMSVIGFQDGTETLTQQMRSWLEKQDNVDIVLDEHVQKIAPRGDEMEITTAARQIHANHVISAMPSRVLDTVTKSNPLPNLSYNPAVDVAVVNLAYGPEVNLPYDGFGFLTPHPDSEYKLPVPGTLGVVFDSNAMRGQDKQHPDLVKMTVMIGGHQWSNAFKTPIEHLDPNEAYAYALKAVQTYLGITAEPRYAMTSLHAKCIPQYLVGHETRLGELHHAIKKDYGHLLSVTGASYWSVSVPDCIKNSRELVEELLVSGALGSRKKAVTGLSRIEEIYDGRTMEDSARLDKSHVDILMKS